MLPENAIALDARLSAIRDLAGSCARFADIGADHGRLGAHMLLHGLCARAQLADISAASLIKARRLIYGLGLTDRVDFCVGDGAQALKERPDVAVIAGMGGQTIAGIVERGRDILSGSRLVLQPNVAAPELRARLQAARFRITMKSSPAMGGGCISSSRRRRGRCALRRRRGGRAGAAQKAPAAAFRLRGLPPARGGQGLAGRAARTRRRGGL